MRRITWNRPALRVVIGLLMVGPGLSACGGDDLDRDSWAERGEQTLRPFKQQLMGALVEAMEDGPEGAIEVCRTVAPGIAEDLGSGSAVLGRTSHRLRNPGNTPREWVRPLLEDYVATPDRVEPEVVRLKDGGVGYVEPILVKPMCLTCHGSDIPAGVASRLDALYPQDEARGFAEGDFRGLFWVEFHDAE